MNPGAAAPHIGMCHIFCDISDTLMTGFGPHMAEVMSDIPNYTDLQKGGQISEVVVG